MINYQYQIGNKVTYLKDDLNVSGIASICKSENAVCKGVRTEEYYKGFAHAKTITYIFERKQQ